MYVYIKGTYVYLCTCTCIHTNRYTDSHIYFIIWKNTVKIKEKIMKEDVKMLLEFDSMLVN